MKNLPDNIHSRANRQSQAGRGFQDSPVSFVFPRREAVSHDRNMGQDKFSIVDPERIYIGGLPADD